MSKASVFYQAEQLSADEFKRAEQLPDGLEFKNYAACMQALEGLNITQNHDWARSFVTQQEVDDLVTAIKNIEPYCGWDTEAVAKYEMMKDGGWGHFDGTAEKIEIVAKNCLLIAKGQKAAALGFEISENAYQDDYFEGAGAGQLVNYNLWRAGYHMVHLMSSECLQVMNLDQLRSEEKYYSDYAPTQEELDSNPYPANSYAAHFFDSLRAEKRRQGFAVGAYDRYSSVDPAALQQKTNQKRQEFGRSRSWCLVFNEVTRRLESPAETKIYKPERFNI